MYLTNVVSTNFINPRLTKILNSKSKSFIKGLPSVPILHKRMSFNSGLHLTINEQCSSKDMNLGLLSYIPADIFAIDKKGIPFSVYIGVLCVPSVICLES